MKLGTRRLQFSTNFFHWAVVKQNSSSCGEILRTSQCSDETCWPLRGHQTYVLVCQKMKKIRVTRDLCIAFSVFYRHGTLHALSMSGQCCLPPLSRDLESEDQSTITSTVHSESLGSTELRVDLAVLVRSRVREPERTRKHLFQRCCRVSCERLPCSLYKIVSRIPLFFCSNPRKTLRKGSSRPHFCFEKVSSSCLALDTYQIKGTDSDFD